MESYYWCWKGQYKLENKIGIGKWDVYSCWKCCWKECGFGKSEVGKFLFKLERIEGSWKIVTEFRKLKIRPNISDLYSFCVLSLNILFYANAIMILNRRLDQWSIWNFTPIKSKKFEFRNLESKFWTTSLDSAWKMTQKILKTKWSFEFLIFRFQTLTRRFVNTVTVNQSLIGAFERGP